MNIYVYIAIKIILAVIIGYFLGMWLATILHAADKLTCISDVKAPDSVQCFVWMPVVMKS